MADKGKTPMGKPCPNCGNISKKEDPKFCSVCKRSYSYKTKRQKWREEAKEAQEDANPFEVIQREKTGVVPATEEETPDLLGKDDPLAPPFPGLDDSPPGSLPPGGQSISSKLPKSPEILRKSGRNLGRIILFGLDKLLKDESSGEDKEEFMNAWGEIAENHPELFQKWMADAVPAGLIVTIILAKVMKAMERTKKEKEMAEKYGVGKR